jgi:hypothetical protein
MDCFDMGDESADPGPETHDRNDVTAVDQIGSSRRAGKTGASRDVFDDVI